MRSRSAATLYFLLAFAAVIFAIHLSYLKLPFFWDEAGAFVPAALDLFRSGAWVPHAAIASVHPPGLPALLALVWRIAGFSIVGTRLTMLALASLGALFAFLLAIRLSRGAAGAPAFAAVLFLIATPLFFTQAMLAQLDMPAMVFTSLALLLFLDQRYAACAMACTAAVLMKETAISTPLVFAVWLWFKDGKRREAVYFLVPFIALAIWVAALWHATGHLLGNAAFLEYNLTAALRPAHVTGAILRRIYFLFVSDGRWIGSVALYAGWRMLQTREWKIAGSVALAQALVVTVFGGATLERYLLPVLPILYAAVATALSIYPPGWRWATQLLMIAMLLAGWVWDPWHAFPRENNLEMVDFIELNQQASDFLRAYESGKSVATTWPLSEELLNPELGYVDMPIRVQTLSGFALTQIANIDPARNDLLIVYSRPGPFEGLPFERWSGRIPPAGAEEIRAGTGYSAILRMERRGQWLEIYARH